VNLETLAALRGEAWARRVFRRTTIAPHPSAEQPWPGNDTEARELAATLGSPRLVAVLAAIIQERAKAAWSLFARR
jgi:hypothetical protein